MTEDFPAPHGAVIAIASGSFVSPSFSRASSPSTSGWNPRTSSGEG
jgi:hypothetical protein